VIPSIRTIWQENGIPRFRPHDLRATAATDMDRLGILKDDIRLVLNHVDGDVTDSYIRHHKRERKWSALDRWSTELQAILKGEGKTDRKAEVVDLAQATG
jgi:integrase